MHGTWVPKHAYAMLLMCVAPNTIPLNSLPAKQSPSNPFHTLISLKFAPFPPHTVNIVPQRAPFTLLVPDVRDFETDGL